MDRKYYHDKESQWKVKNLYLLHRYQQSLSKRLFFSSKDWSACCYNFETQIIEFHGCIGSEICFCIKWLTMWVLASHTVNAEAHKWQDGRDTEHSRVKVASRLAIKLVDVIICVLYFAVLIVVASCAFNTSYVWLTRSEIEIWERYNHNMNLRSEQKTMTLKKQYPC